jgi:hypothetical protein
MEAAQRFRGCWFYYLVCFAFKVAVKLVFTILKTRLDLQGFVAGMRGPLAPGLRRASIPEQLLGTRLAEGQHLPPGSR